MLGQNVKPLTRVNLLAVAIRNRQARGPGRFKEPVQEVLDLLSAKILELVGCDNVHICKQEGGVIASVSDAAIYVLRTSAISGRVDLLRAT